MIIGVTGVESSHKGAPGGGEMERYSGWGRIEGGGCHGATCSTGKW